MLIGVDIPRYICIFLNKLQQVCEIMTQKAWLRLSHNIGQMCCQ